MSSLPANFVPVRRAVADVSLSKNAVITTTVPHGYHEGQWIRIIIPRVYGMEIDYEATQISNVASTTFETTIDTRAQLPFAVPSVPPAFTEAHAVPISGVEDNIGLS